jgi:glycine betaine/proline transport system substrate-binding protein
MLMVLGLLLAACGTAGELAAGDDDGGPAGGADGGGDGTVRMARATWDTGFMQAEIYRQLLTELGFDVTDPADATLDANVFYPALARGEYDFWANGWFPLHDIYLDRERFTGQVEELPISPVGTQVPVGALQGYLVDAATAEELGITSMADLTRSDVAATFDTDGDGAADLIGCNEGWGCNEAISRHIAELDWGDNVEQVVGDYSELFSDVVDRVEAGEPALFYTWTPNWTIDVLTPGEDVVWLESPALPEDEGRTEVAELVGCAAELPCQLGWVANDIRVVANDDFLDANPSARALFEAVEIPRDDIAAQNAEMQQAGDYTAADIADDAAEWIEANRSDVDAWLEQARAAGE